MADLAADVADPRNVLPEAIALFSEQTAGLPLSEHESVEPPTIANDRRVLEHGQNLEIRGGLGFASGQDGWFVAYRRRMWKKQGCSGAGRRDAHARNHLGKLPMQENDLPQFFGGSGP